MTTNTEQTQEAISVVDTLKLALDLLKQNDEFLYLFHECESEEEIDQYTLIRKRNENAIAFAEKALAHAPSEREQPAPVAKPHEQPEPVVVARVDDLERGGRVRALAMNLSLDAPLYTSPQPSKPWGGLTDEECDAIYNALDEWAKDVDSYDFGLPRIAGGGVVAGREVIRRAIEAKLRELNEHREKNA